MKPVPFQVNAWPCCPTATQKVGLRHETELTWWMSPTFSWPSSSLSASLSGSEAFLGLIDCEVQMVPFQIA